MSKPKDPHKKIICFCNNIDQDTIEKAIHEGALTLNQIYDATTAGVGPCGGSCRRKIAPLLEKLFSEKETPEPAAVSTFQNWKK